MYYLRKKPYKKEYTDPITGEKDYIEFTDDRAVFKHNRFNRMYRKNFYALKMEYIYGNVKHCKIH